MKIINKDCGLCRGENFSSGKDTFLCEIDNHIIFDNGIPYTVNNGKVVKYRRRFTIFPKKHVSELSEIEEKKVKKILINYLFREYSLDTKGFLIIRTGATYNDHYHIHAFILPSKIVAGQTDLSFLPQY